MDWDGLLYQLRNLIKYCLGAPACIGTISEVDLCFCCTFSSKQPDTVVSLRNLVPWIRRCFSCLYGHLVACMLLTLVWAYWNYWTLFWAFRICSSLVLLLCAFLPSSVFAFWQSCCCLRVARRAGDSSNLVDSASSHTLVSKTKPCTSKYKSFTLKLRMAHYISYSLFDSPLLLG